MSDLPSPDSSLVEALRHLHLFSQLSPTDLALIATRSKKRKVSKDTYLIHQGDEAESLYLIFSGTFKVYVEQKEIGFEKILATLHPGDHFGELAVLAGDKRSTSVVALSDGEVLEITRDDLQDLMRSSPSLSIALNGYLARFALRTIDQTAQIPLLNLDNFPEVMKYQHLLPETITAACKAIPLEIENRQITIGMVNAYDADTRAFLKQTLREFELQFVAISEEQFRHYLRERQISSGTRGSITSTSTITELNVRGADGRSARLGEYDQSMVLEKIFREGIELGASDIHLEPRQPNPQVRLRLNGNLIRRNHEFRGKSLNQVISNIKVLSNLDITERRLPQDGSFRIEADHRLVDVRVSVIPCHGGEKVVMRLLDPDTQKVDLSDIILAEPVALLAKEMFVQPNGLFLVTGPTGAGKTTTLYAGLHEIWKQRETLNIMTVEDPIDYHLPFATQVQVNNTTGLTFARILRSALRQDPDVMLIGEIRDAESAAISLHAAITGHMVLSSLHSNFVREAVTRLLNLIPEPDLIGSALKGVISQRLTGWLCEECKTTLPTDDPVYHKLRELGIIAPDENPVFSTSKGCEACAFSGHIGRVGVFELLSVAGEIEDMITSGTFTQRFKNTEASQHFVPMTRYARYLLGRQLVSPEEILRCFTHIISMPESI